MNKERLLLAAKILEQTDPGFFWGAQTPPNEILDTNTVKDIATFFDITTQNVVEIFNDPNLQDPKGVAKRIRNFVKYNKHKKYK